MNGKWMQRTLINDQVLASKLKDIDGPIFNVKIIRDKAELDKATVESESTVLAIMELSIPESFTQDIIGNFLKDLSKHVIFETMGIKPENAIEG